MMIGVALVPPLSAPVVAQNGPPNALQGFSQNRDQPVRIDAASLEVRDKDKVATFAGNVRLVQGDTTLRSKTLVVFYEQDATPVGMKTEIPSTSGDGAKSIKRLEAKGGVIVTQRDQTATGDNGVFDIKANTVTLLGHGVISQGQNVAKGDRLVVNLTTGVSRVECNISTQCRVSALIAPNNASKESGQAGGAGGSSKRLPASPRGLY